MFSKDIRFRLRNSSAMSNDNERRKIIPTEVLSYPGFAHLHNWCKREFGGAEVIWIYKALKRQEVIAILDDFDENDPMALEWRLVTIVTT